MVRHDRERDSQRSKVYAAENAAFDFARRRPQDPARHGRHRLSLAESQQYVDKVIGSAWFRRAFEISDRRDPAIEVVGGGRNGGATSFGSMYGGSIRVSPGARREWLLLHEISHNVTTSKMGHLVAGHGWYFCSVYLKLVQHHLGAEAAKALKAEFRSRKVKFTEPRPKRKLSPEQAEKARANLAAIRARKAAEKAAAAAAEPLKIEVEQGGNFSGTRGVRYDISDQTDAVFLFESMGFDGRGWLMTAGEARRVGPEKAAEFAKARPGHEIELRIIGRAGRYRYGESGWQSDRAEITRFVFDPDEFEAEPVADEIVAEQLVLV